MRMGSRNVISGPTIWASLAFGVHPVGITKAVRKPPNLWTRARQPPVAIGTGTGSDIDISHTPFTRGRTVRAAIAGRHSCLAAGDQILSDHPLRPRRMRKAVSRWVKPRPPPRRLPRATAGTPGTDPS